MKNVYEEYPNQAAYLNSITVEERMEILYRLICGEWILPEKPNDWDNLDFDAKFDRARSIIEYIEYTDGHKAYLRYAHKRDFGRTDQEFDDWWDSLVYKNQNLFHNRFDGYQNRNYKRYYSNSLVEFIVSFSLGSIATSLLFQLIQFFAELG